LDANVQLNKLVNVFFRSHVYLSLYFSISSAWRTWVIWVGTGHMVHNALVHVFGLRHCSQDAVLAQGGQRDAAVNFGTYQSLQWHRAVFTAM